MKMMNFHNYYSTSIKSLVSLISLALLVLTYYGFSSYVGSKVVYLIFTIISHSLLILGLTSQALFFDFFIGLFFWLGFWLKFTIKVAFYDGVFPDRVGYFDGSSISFDHALLVASVGMGGLLLATLIRRKFFTGYLNYQPNFSDALEAIYKKNRLKIFFVFFLIIIFIGSTNFIFAIYQKGTITETFLPFGLNSVYKWLLIFGLASFSSIILDLEFRIRKDVSLISISISIFETFFTSVSMLSRGMILNSSSLIYGLLIMYRLKKKRINLKLLFLVSLIFLLFFIIAHQSVSVIRNNTFFDRVGSAGSDVMSQFGERNHLERAIFIDRWVGIEGVMAVSSHPNMGLKLFKDAINETYNEKDTSFYDKYILTDSPYAETDKSKHHFVSLPGVIAFFYYPGSYILLFLTMLVIGGFSAILEFVNYKITNNLVLVSLISQVVAYRFSNFGYVPSQSHLLFGAIIANILLIYIMKKLL